MYIDSHCHLDDEQYDDDREVLIQGLRAKGIEYVVNIGTNIASSETCVQMAQQHEVLYAAVGVHPHDAKELETASLEEIEKWVASPKMVAIGEIGLDYHYDYSPRDIQKKWFAAQIDLAKKYGLPIIVHDREAHKDTYDIIMAAQDGSLKGVIHSFSGSVEMAREYIKLGFYIGLGGPVTFKNAVMPKEVAKAIPLDRLLLETDGPYMSPTPLRGKRNEPQNVQYVAEAIAALRDISVEEVMAQTTLNAKTLFGLDA